MRVAVITANMGSFEKTPQHVKQSVPYDYHSFDDSNFPPRICSMTSRLQARIPKMFGWQMIPNEYDYYIWIDSSSAFSHKDSVKWFIDNCQNVDIAVFKHPQRNSIEQEADYIKYRLRRKCEYITPRYKNELADEQVKIIKQDKDYNDDCLFVTTAFVYKHTPAVEKMMIDWWYHTSRFHSVDQLSFPYVLKKSGCPYAILPARLGHSRISSPYLTLVRS